MNKFAIITLGCKVNQYESEVIAESLKAAGWIPAHDKEAADLCIINTCTVTQKASMQSRQAIRQIIRSNPGAYIIVTGCYAQTEADEIRKISGVHDIIGHADKHKIPDMIKNSNLNKPASNIKHQTSNIKHQTSSIKHQTSRTRPFLKIQDGCNAFCTYCIVPYARGRSRSMPLEDVLENIRRVRAAGYHEIVLTGIHLGCYGLDLSPEISLSELLHRIHDSEAIERLRLSSIEPHELTDDIIELAAKPGNICPHFHIPLQSGDDLILERMHRPYTSAYFRELVMNIREKIPHASVGADTLIGFPGESEAAFENTRSLIQDLPVTYLHVFPFSPRKGTLASTYPDKIPSKVIKERCRKMREIGNVKKQEFYRELIGKTVEVLIEGKRDGSSGLLKGLTPNYIPVLVRGGDDLKSTIAEVRVEEVKERPIASYRLSADEYS